MINKGAHLFLFLPYGYKEIHFYSFIDVDAVFVAIFGMCPKSRRDVGW